MEKVKDILLIILGIAIALAFLWFFFFVALPVLAIIGLIVIVFFLISSTDAFKKIKKKIKKKADKIKEAEIIDEK